MANRAVVLLSGGMDSATALWSALRRPDMTVSSVISVDYGQAGADMELLAAQNLLTYAQHNLELPSGTIKHRIVNISGLDTLSGLTTSDPGGAELGRQFLDTKIPFTFVPARNLIMLSIAAGVAFDDLARFIVGGWVMPDSPYPDCRLSFLGQAENAINYALGTDKPNVNARGWVRIHAPVLVKTKREVVEWGAKMEVPWELTRSCYQGTSEPCMECDSCIKRMGAFVDAGLTDPLVQSSLAWKAFRRAYLKGEFDGPVS